MNKGDHNMTRDERQQLEALRKAKIPVAQIARQLGFCRQTIYNELDRGAYIHTCDYWDEVRYSADKGQQVHEDNQTAKGRPLKIGNDREYANFLEKKCWVSRIMEKLTNENAFHLLRHWQRPKWKAFRRLFAQPRYTAT